MIEKIREIVVEDFKLSELQPISVHIEEIDQIKDHANSLSHALHKLESMGVKSVLSVMKDSKVIRVAAEDFLDISEIGGSKIRNTHSGKFGVLNIEGTEVLAVMNDEQVEELISTRHPFNFWYSDLYATNLGEFYDALEKVSEKSLKHHLKSKDFSSWLEAIGEKDISKEFSKIERNGKNIKSIRNVLRTTLLKYVEDEIKKRLNI